MEFIRTLAGSFYSADTYVQARAPQTGMKLLYSLLLVMVTCAIIIVYGITVVHRALLQPAGESRPLADRVLMSLAEQVPVMTLEHSKLNVKAKQPYVIYFELGDAAHTKYPFITIDTTGHGDLHTMDTPILVTAHEIYAKSSKDTRVYSIDSLAKDIKNPLIINRALATDSAERLLDWLHGNAWKIYLIIGIPVWMGFVFVAYILRVIMIMALGLVGMLASQLWKPSMDFATGVQIAAVAYTPVALLDMLLLCSRAHPLSAYTLLALGTAMVCVGTFVSRARA